MKRGIIDFAVFIISHGRAETLTTYDVLRKSGYTGKIYVVIDDLDNQRHEYEKRFGFDTILVFAKKKYALEHTDCGLCEPLLKFAVFARNAVEDFATQLGLDCFSVWDDDIEKIRHRYISGESLLSKDVIDLDNVFLIYLQFMLHGNITTLGFAQCVLYMGGIQSFLNWKTTYRRQCLGVMIRNAKKKVKWGLNLYEDVTTPQTNCMDGNVWLTLTEIQYDTPNIGLGITSGGNSDVYRTLNPYVQTFFPILSRPDCNFIKYRDSRFRVAELSPGYVYPQIISSTYKKEK